MTEPGGRPDPRRPSRIPARRIVAFAVLAGLLLALASYSLLLVGGYPASLLATGPREGVVVVAFLAVFVAGLSQIVLLVATRTLARPGGARGAPADPRPLGPRPAARAARV